MNECKRGPTLEVGHHDLGVVGAGEQVVGAGGEAHRAHVAAVGAVGLHGAAPPDVVQHAGAVLLARGQETPAGVHRYRGNGAACGGGGGKGETGVMLVV